MFLERLQLANFKSFEFATFQFSPSFNLICGSNGVGKTNVFDAIHYLSFCKAHLPFRNQSSIRMGCDFFSLKGAFKLLCGKEDLDQVFVALENKKLLVKCNGKPYKRLLDHIGKFPLVILSPQDQNLILGGSEVRRRWVDMIISQVDQRYLESLSSYSRTLLQRNTALKSGIMDAVLYQGYDEQLSWCAEVIYQARKKFIDYLKTEVSSHLKLIAPNDDGVVLSYQTQMEDLPFSLKSLLQNSFQKDLHLRRTTCGIHKDDLVFQVYDKPIKAYLSQGQQRSFLIALRISEYAYIAHSVPRKPMLLLDDLFDKLDTLRIEALISMLIEKDFGQIFITDTDPVRFDKMIQSRTKEYKIFKL